MVSQTMSDMSANALAYYPLKSDVNDYMGNTSRNGIITGNFTYVPGAYGNAANFSEAGGSIQFPAGAFERYANYYTVCAWINVTECSPLSPETGGMGTVVGRFGVDYSTGKLRFYFYYDSASIADNQFLVFESQSSLQTHLWTHVTVMYDHDAMELSFFINGMVDSVYSLAAQIQSSDRPHLPMYSGIGGNAQNSQELDTFNGSISDVMVFNDTLDMCCIAAVSGYMNFTATAEFPGANGDDEQSLGPLVVLAFVVVFVAIVIVEELELRRSAINQVKTQPSAPPSPKQITLQQMADGIKSIVGSPAQAGKQASRQQLNIPDSQRVRIDIGGLGAYIHSGSKAPNGFADSLNMNYYSVNPDSTPANATVPYLILVNDWITMPVYPLADNFADYVTMQNAPLYDFYVGEINRIVRMGGSVGLWIDLDFFQPQVNQLASLFNCTPLPCTADNGNLGMDEFGGKSLYPKLLLTKKPKNNIPVN